jgi:hypothetical protein
MDGDCKHAKSQTSNRRSERELERTVCLLSAFLDAIFDAIWSMSYQQKLLSTTKNIVFISTKYVCTAQSQDPKPSPKLPALEPWHLAADLHWRIDSVRNPYPHERHLNI